MQIHNRPYVGEKIRILDGYFQKFEVSDETDLSRVTFSECLFEFIDISAADGTINSMNLPSFDRCMIGTLTGVKGPEDLPKGKFNDGNQIEKFSGIGSSNAEILESDLPLSVRVLLTIIKKTFFQAGGARQEAALYRGLDIRARAYVSDILLILQRHNILRESTKNGPTLWQAQRDKVGLARAIMESPTTSKSAVLLEVREL